MISSVPLLICFVVLLTKKDRGIRLMSVFCMSHILLENSIFYYFSKNPIAFDLSLYLTICWSLDVVLLFFVACVLLGTQKKLVATIGLPFLLFQVFIIQYPDLFPALFNFSFSSSYLNFMEAFIFVCSLKDTSISEWVKTSIILFCIIALHLMA